MHYMHFSREDQIMQSKKIVLAEKPSVAREIAKVINVHGFGKGYIEGEQYIVTWALGHLVELSQPASYNQNYRRWSLSSLPMLPSPLTQQVSEGTKEQFETIRSLLMRDDVSTLIIATDAGREGELVARWIIKEAKWNGEIKRLWISSQTRSAIEDGFRNLKDGDLYEGLYKAGEARAAADWYVGMNVTRALTTKYDAKLSSGRVQTPTLALITSREDEREAFLGEMYWTVRANFGLFSASVYDGDEVAKISDGETADQLVSSLEHATAEVVSIERTERREEPPLAYDLTELQRDANTILSFSAKETLDVLQRLYEVHKIVSYPRTDSRYITEDIVQTIPARLNALRDTTFSTITRMYEVDGYRKDLGRFVMESRVTDHHAIIPTEERANLSKLSEKERSLWNLIALRFLQVLSNDHLYDSVSITLKSGSTVLKSKSTVSRQNGWKDMIAFAEDSVRKYDTADLLSDDGIIASVNTKDTFTIHKVRSRKVNVTPPPRYTEATLLSAMEHAGRFIEDSDLKKDLKGGIGTPATRADIIEKLIGNHYIEREGKYLVPTPYGRELVRLAPSLLQSPQVTGEWERRLSAIAESQENYDDFIEDIKKKTAELVESIRNSHDSFSPKFSDAKKCPYCSSPMIKVIDKEQRVHNICSRLSCSYEEMEIKRKKKVVIPQTSPAAVKVKTVSSNTANSMKKVVVKKKKVAEIPYETVIEVVRESKLARRRNSYQAPRKSEPKRPDRERNHDSGGTTFADLLAASEKRKRDRDRKKRK